MLVEVLVNTLANISTELGIGSAADHSMGCSRLLRSLPVELSLIIAISEIAFSKYIHFVKPLTAARKPRLLGRRYMLTNELPLFGSHFGMQI